MRKGVKAALISVICVVVIAAILTGVLIYFRNQTDPVAVSPAMNYIGYFGDSMLYYDGQVTADNLQSVYPSDTQTVTEILVTEGQTVKAGDPLLSYDTTLSEIQIERKRIEVQQAELNLQNAKRELAEINAMKPYTPPPETEPPTEPPTEPLEPVEELPYFLCGNGSQEDPYRWLWSDELTFDEAFLRTELGDMADEVWLAFEVREENAVEGALCNRWGLHVMALYGEDGTRTLCYAFFDPEDAPAQTPDVQPDVQPDDDIGWVDDSSGYTAAQIAQMRAEKQKEIRDLDVAYRLAQVEYERMQDEAENGVVYAKVDGKVIGLTDPETAMMEGRPLLTVSGGGSFYVQVAISEYDRQNYPIGTEVQISSWMSGVELSGTITAISDLPTTGYYYGEGNSDVSLYNATVAVAPDAGLQEDEYVSVMFGTAETGDGLYLADMFIRTENGASYIYKRGADGKLEKCYVTLGDSRWGYTAVLSGLSEEDYIAFPYGNDVRPGAETVEDENGINAGIYY